mmetsp:Transcript_24349/g.78227  ORF Transcript_24349/g.78227 Transcript_24349/m.78227 type:complete len:309 (-) Transcript_24349:125-1051(-)
MFGEVPERDLLRELQRHLGGDVGKEGVGHLAQPSVLAQVLRHVVCERLLRAQLVRLQLCQPRVCLLADKHGGDRAGPLGRRRRAAHEAGGVHLLRRHRGSHLRLPRPLPGALHVGHRARTQVGECIVRQRGQRLLPVHHADLLVRRLVPLGRRQLHHVRNVPRAARELGAPPGAAVAVRLVLAHLRARDAGAVAGPAVDAPRAAHVIAATVLHHLVVHVLAHGWRRLLGAGHLGRVTRRRGRAAGAFVGPAAADALVLGARVVRAVALAPESLRSRRYHIVARHTLGRGGLRGPAPGTAQRVGRLVRR